jgi:hypothetical protein
MLDHINQFGNGNQLLERGKGTQLKQRSTRKPTVFNRMQNNRPSNFSRGKVEKTCLYAA